MKKTLFAMAALALCGTAVAETYNLSNYKNSGFFAPSVYGFGEAVVLNVDQTVDSFIFDVSRAGSLTLNFNGASEIFARSFLVMNLTSSAPLSITGDNDAKIHWGESLTSSAGEVKTLTLASTEGTFYAPDSASFEGLTESGSITLGGAALTYMGFYAVDTAAAAEALITGDNQIALVAISGTKQVALVGKIGGAATPEPATATLSLLALAGLASRRRRK